MQRLAIALVLLGGCANGRGAVTPAVQVDVNPVAANAAPVVVGAKVAAPHRRAGDAVEVEWRGEWWPARILSVRGDKYLVRYDGYGEEWDEAVGEDRVRDPVPVVLTPMEDDDDGSP